jgi:hypothetical protein
MAPLLHTLIDRPTYDAIAILTTWASCFLRIELEEQEARIQHEVARSVQSASSESIEQQKKITNREGGG